MLEFFKYLDHILLTRVDAGDVRHWFDVVVRADQRSDLHRFLALSQAAASAIGHADVICWQTTQAEQGVVDHVVGTILFGREDLQGVADLFVFENIRNVHVSPINKLLFSQFSC